MGITVRNNQSLLDIAIQTSGSAEDAFDLALENDLSLTEHLTAGQNLTAIPVSNRRVVDFYVNNSIFPATATDEDDERIGIFDETFDETFE